MNNIRKILDDFLKKGCIQLDLFRTCLIKLTYYNTLCPLVFEIWKELDKQYIVGNGRIFALTRELVHQIKIVESSKEYT